MTMPPPELPNSLLFCRLCQSLYSSPRTLPCLHSFCLQCLSHLSLSPLPQGGQSGVCCPLCGQLAPLGEGGVGGLRLNEFLVRMCQEYVGEVHKTLVASRAGEGPGSTLQGSMSPASSLQGSMSPASASWSGSMSPALATLQGSMSPASRYLQSSPSSVLSSHTTTTHTPPPHGHFHYPPSSSPPYRSSPHSLTAISPGASTPHSFLRSLTATPSSLSPAPSSPSGCMSPCSVRSSSGSVLVHQTARRLSVEANPSRGVGVHRRLSSTPEHVVHAWERLQGKLSALQSASLRVTYSLEAVHHAQGAWQQRKQDLRRDVQRRSAQLQFFVKRQERLLLAALDSRQTDQAFHAGAEQARGQLRANLKALMHETDVVKSVLDLATDQEILSLTSLLLGSRVSQTTVAMETPELRLLVPEEVSLEEMVGRDFGCLTSTPNSQVVFTPEETHRGFPEDDELTEDPPSSPNTPTTSSAHFGDDFDDVAFIDDDDEDEEREETVEEVLEFVDGKMQVVSKRSVPCSPAGTGSSAQGRTQQQAPQAAAGGGAEQNSRGRATHVRRTANSAPSGGARVDHPDRTGTGLSDQPEGRESHQGQSHTAVQAQEAQGATQQTSSSGPGSSLEKFQQQRECLRQRRRQLLLNTGGVMGEGRRAGGALRRVQSLDRGHLGADTRGRPFSGARRDEVSVAAPVIPTPTNEQRDITQPVTQQRDVTPTSKEQRGITRSNRQQRDVTQTSKEQTGVTQHATNQRGATLASSGGVTVVAPPVMSTSLIYPECSSKEERSSRPIRRAVSAASDRASKMEYLRETWRQRKELLMHSQGYIPTPEHHGEGEEPKGPSHLEGSGGGGQEGEKTAESSPTERRVKPGLRGRLSSLKQALRKTGRTQDGKETAHPPTPTTVSTPTSTPGSEAKAQSPQHTAAQAAAEQKVLRTIENILQKKGANSGPQPKPSLPSPSTGSKPSLRVKPRPRDPPPPFLPHQPSPPSSPPLETLPEQRDIEAGAAHADTQRGNPAERGRGRTSPEREGRIPSQRLPSPEREGRQRVQGLRVTSPGREERGERGEGGQDSLQHLRANIRQKKERWRSLSLH